MVREPESHRIAASATADVECFEEDTDRMVDLSKLNVREEVLRGEATFVVNLADLDAMSEADAARFLELNVFTGGMKTMLKHAFERLNGKSAGRPILKLSETMGGGKTQSLLSAGILAKFPHLAQASAIGLQLKAPSDCVVVAFSGRNTDKVAWVEIGKRIGADLPVDRPPSEDEWRSAFEGKTVLILLDELSFYLVGLTTQGKVEEGRQLAQRASLALTNMFGAIRDYKEARRVVAVVSDLQKDWDQGEEELARILQAQPGLQGTVDSVNNEMSKGAMTISPVDPAKDELYDILKMRLFETISTTPKDIEKIADAYGNYLEPLKSQLSRSIPQIKSLVASAYPFHFSTKDLIASFNQNPGFQKTRDVIRLFAEIVRSVWTAGREDLARRYTLSLADADFNDAGLSSRLTEIKPSLQDARTTDVAASGGAHAETVSDQADGLTVEAAKWIYIASLSETQVRGLDQRELLEYMARPGADVSKLSGALDLLYDRCWYIERNSAGYYYFHRKKNLNARIRNYESTCSTAERDGVVQDKLFEMFTPRDRRCYQRLEVFPKLDEISVKKDAVSLLVVRPDTASRAFYDRSLYKNRMMFLTAQDATGLINVNQRAKRVWAIRQVAKDLPEEPDTTKGNIQEAEEKQRDYETQLFLSIQSVFNSLLFPIADDGNADLERVDLADSYQDRPGGPLVKYRNEVATKGEFVVEATLRSASKFVGFDLKSGDLVKELQPLRHRFETFLFPASNRIRWDDLQEQMAVRPEIVWTEPGVAERMKDVLVQHGIWRISGTDIEKGPFEERTGVTVDFQRNDATGEITITDFQLEHADTLEAREDEGQWKAIPIDRAYQSTAMTIEFRAVDSSGAIATGSVFKVDNRIDLKVRQTPVPNADAETVTARGIPADVEILHTVDGSDPVNFGVPLPPCGVTASAGTVIRILARKGGKSEGRTVTIQKTGIDPSLPARVAISKIALHNRQKVREFVRLLPDDCLAENAAVIARSAADGTEELSVRWPTGRPATKPGLAAAMDFLEAQVPGCEEQLRVIHLLFTSGASFVKWRTETGVDIKDKDVTQ